MTKTMLTYILGLVLIALPAISEVRYYEDYDEFTNKDNSVVVLTPEPNSDDIDIGWKCGKSSGNLFVLAAHGYLAGNFDDEVYIQFKFGNSEPTRARLFSMSKDQKFTQLTSTYNMEVEDFLTALLRYNHFSIRITDPHDDHFLTAKYDLFGLEQNLRKLSCYKNAS